MTKTMTCWKCFNVYTLETATHIRVKRLERKQPACPKCKCMVYV